MKSLNFLIFKSDNNKDGYLLVELIVAISLLTVGFLGFLGLISRSISLNSVISDQFVANYLASEGIEVVKNLIDANVIQKRPWNDGFGNEKCYEVDYKTMNISEATETNCPSNSVNSIRFDSSTGVYSYAVGNPVKFYRTVHITPVSNDEIKVNSVVKWVGRGSIKNEINLEDHFFNWRL